MIYKNPINKCALLVGITLLWSIAAFAQSLAGGINVTLVEISTGREIITKTDDKGNFAFSNVSAGTYRLRIGCARSNPESDPGTPVERSARREQQCLAEMRVQVSENSNGNITGTIQQTSPGK